MGKKEREDEELGINRNDYRCDFEYENANKIAVAGAGAIIAGAAVGGPVGAGVAAKVMAGGLVAGAVDAAIDQDLCERKKRGELVREAKLELIREQDEMIEKLMKENLCTAPKPAPKPEPKPVEPVVKPVEEDRFKKELHAIIDAPSEIVGEMQQEMARLDKNLNKELNQIDKNFDERLSAIRAGGLSARPPITPGYNNHRNFEPVHRHPRSYNPGGYYVPPQQPMNVQGPPRQRVYNQNNFVGPMKPMVGPRRPGF